MRASLLVAGVIAGALCQLAPAQNCGSPTANFWKTDTLPQVPSGAEQVSIIQGLCEGEAAGMAFYLSPGEPAQELTKVAIGFGAPFGAPGFTATANVEIYDGITWNGNIPTLGPKVFDLNDDFGTDLQLTSTGINEFDMSSTNTVVGGSGAFVVAFRMNINLNGSCAGGYNASFITDGAGGACSTVPMTSLIDIQGVGWRDARTATVGGFPLCPLFYNGNWIIRACTEDTAMGTPPFEDLGCDLSGTFAPALGGSGDPSPGGSFSLDFTGMPPSTTGTLFVGVAELKAPFKGGFLVPAPLLSIGIPTIFGSLSLPATMPPSVPSGTGLWLQAWFPDAGAPKNVSGTNGLKINVP